MLVMLPASLDQTIASTALPHDRRRAKRVLQTALALFLIGSAPCGLSQSMTELIAFRAAIERLGRELDVEAPAPPPAPAAA